MTAINSQFPPYVNSQLTSIVFRRGRLIRMKQREVKIPPGDASAIGGRLRQRLRHHRQKYPEAQDQAWLAAQLGISKAMVNRMLNHAHGSLAGWRKACLVLESSMDYVVYGRMEKADQSFTAMLNANSELTRAVAQLREERNRLLDQVEKLRMVK